MDLRDVADGGQLAEYYRLNNLNTVEERINALRTATKIIGVRCEKNKKPEGLLAMLQESVLLGHWRAA